MTNKYKKPKIDRIQCLVHYPEKYYMDFSCPSCILEIMRYELGTINSVREDVRDYFKILKLL